MSHGPVAPALSALATTNSITPGNNTQSNCGFIHPHPWPSGSYQTQEVVHINSIHLVRVPPRNGRIGKLPQSIVAYDRFGTSGTLIPQATRSHCKHAFNAAANCCHRKRQPVYIAPLWTCPVNPHLMHIGCNIYLFIHRASTN
jgi:hypothetical protein